MEIILCCLDGPNVITKILKLEEGAEEKVAVMGKKIRPPLMSEFWGRLKAKEYGKPLELEKAGNWILLWDLQKGTLPYQHLQFSPLSVR